MAPNRPIPTIRLIGIENAGREIIRIDRKGSGRAGCCWFPTPICRQRQGETSSSRRSLCEPARPTCRRSFWIRTTLRHEPAISDLAVAMPIFAPDGSPFGIIKINFDMRPTLDRARTATRPGGLTYVVNGNGDFLVHPDPSQEFASQLGGGATGRQFSLFRRPRSARRATAPRSCRMKRAGRRVAAIAPILLASQEWIAVIETLPNDLLMRPAARLRDMTFIVGFIAMLCAAALAVIVAKSLTRPIKQLTAAVEGVIHNDRFTIPLDAGGEMGVLARAFGARDGRGAGQNRRTRTRGPATLSDRGGARSLRGTGTPL